MFWNAQEMNISISFFYTFPTNWDKKHNWDWVVIDKTAAMTPGTWLFIIFHKITNNVSGQEEYRILFRYDAQEDDEISLMEGEVRC